MLVKTPKVGDKVDLLYPTHGRLNVLRRISGVVVKRGKGPNGPFITVDSQNVFRSLSLKKIVTQ
jgi:hypothetical protein